MHSPNITRDGWKRGDMPGKSLQSAFMMQQHMMLALIPKFPFGIGDSFY
jgi:hypothetical protein